MLRIIQLMVKGGDLHCRYDMWQASTCLFRVFVPYGLAANLGHEVFAYILNFCPLF